MNNLQTVYSVVHFIFGQIYSSTFVTLYFVTLALNSIETKTLITGKLKKTFLVFLYEEFAHDSSKVKYSTSHH